MVDEWCNNIIDGGIRAHCRLALPSPKFMAGQRRGELEFVRARSARNSSVGVGGACT